MGQRPGRWLPLLGRRRPGDEALVKVAGSLVEGEAQAWAETLGRQGLRAEVRPRQEAGQGQPTRPPEWEVWVRQADEPQARLILGLSGRSVIRLPRQKPVRKG